MSRGGMLRRIFLVGLSLTGVCDVDSIKESAFEQQLTLFSPQGRLYQVEYALAASQRHGAPTVCIKGRRVVVAVTKRRRLGPLVSTKTIKQIHAVTREIGCAVAGVAGDEQRLVSDLKEKVLEFRERYGHEMSAPLLALHLADNAQRASQEGEVRPLGATAVLFGIDPTTGCPTLYRVDPSGQFLLCRAAAMGRHFETAERWLQKALPSSLQVGTSSADERDALRECEELASTALACLLSLSAEDEGLKAVRDLQHCPDENSDYFEVAVVTPTSGFRYLSAIEMRAALANAEELFRASLHRSSPSTQQ